MTTRALILLEKLPISLFTSNEHPMGIPKTDEKSVRECVAKIARSLGDHAQRYHAAGWSEKGDIQWSINPSKTAVVGTQELERPD